MDKFGFKVLMFIITAIEIIISATLYFSVQIEALYIISVLLISFLVLGLFSLIFNFPYEEEEGDNTEETPKEENLIRPLPGEAESTLFETFFSIKNSMLICFCFCGFCKKYY